VTDPKLAELEQQLEQLLAAPVPFGLRARVGRRVARELRRPSIDWLTYAGLAAAALVLGANLSWTVTRNTKYVAPPPPPAAKIAAQLRELLPEMSEAEARRQALLLSGSARRPNSVRRTASVTY